MDDNQYHFFLSHPTSIEIFSAFISLIFVYICLTCANEIRYQWLSIHLQIESIGFLHLDIISIIYTQ